MINGHGTKTHEVYSSSIWRTRKQKDGLGISHLRINAKKQKKKRDLSINSAEAFYALPVDNHFVLMKRTKGLLGKIDLPVGVKHFDQLEEADKILKEGICGIIQDFKSRFSRFKIIRKVIDTTE